MSALGSGSKGNGLLVEHRGTCVLVDCGFSLRSTEQRLAQLGLAGVDLDAILVTHEHSDHSKGVRALSEKFGIPVHLSHGSARHKSLAGLSHARIIDGRQRFGSDTGHILGAFLNAAEFTAVASRAAHLPGQFGNQLVVHLAQLFHTRDPCKNASTW